MAEQFESRLPAFDPRRTRGVLSGAMQAVYRDPATAAFADTLDHRRLPAGWEDDPHIQRLAMDAWAAPDRYNSPFFRAWLGNSRLINYEGNPIPFYHSSDAWGIREFKPGTSGMYGVEVPTGTWTSTDPKTSLSYLLRPSHPAFFDEMNDRIKRATAMGLMYGDDVFVPGLGKQDSISLMEHYNVPWSSKEDVYDKITENIWNDLAEQDWKSQRNYLDKFYTEGMTSHVPTNALERVVKLHPTFDEFYDANREMLHVRDMDYDALASGRKIIGPFTTPDMGEIYPLFVKSERPLVISTPSNEPMFWFETNEMVADPRSLSDADRRSLWSKRLADLYTQRRFLNRAEDLSEEQRKDLLSDWQKDYVNHLKSKADYMPDSDVLVSDIYRDNFLYSNKPTDNLVARVRNNGDYDGVLTLNVHDGGAGQLPATDTFAFLNGEQAKSERNLGTFSPNLRDIYRTLGPVMLGGGALAAAMGRPTGASAAPLPDGWVPPSAKAELQGMEPSGWMDPVNWVVDAATAGGGAAMRAGQAALGAAQDWLGEQVPQIPEIPEEYREAAQ